MSDQAVETMWKIVFALFNIVLWPVLLIIIKPFIDDLVNRWRFRRTKAVRLRGRYSDDRGYVYNMTAFLYLARCEHMGDDYEVKGLIESELIEFPATFAQAFPRYPAGSIGFEVVTGRCESRLIERRRHLVLLLRTMAIMDPVLVSRAGYNITISEDRREFTATTISLASGNTGTWSGSAQVR